MKVLALLYEQVTPYFFECKHPRGLPRLKVITNCARM